MSSPPSTICTLSLHDALPIRVQSKCLPRPVHSKCSLHRMSNSFWRRVVKRHPGNSRFHRFGDSAPRSEEHTSELQSLTNLVCRLLLEKKKNEVQCKTDNATDS